VATLSDAGRAEHLRSRIAIKFSDAHVHRLDVGADRYYRVRIGPYPSRDAALARAALGAACGPGPVVRSGTVNTGVLKTVEQTLERVRGLRFTSSVPARVLDDAEVKALLDRELAREFRPGDLERLGTIYGRLGFLAPGTTLEPALRELYADQIAALYDPRTKTLALTAAGLRQKTFTLSLLGLFTGRDLLGEVLVAHELTH